MLQATTQKEDLNAGQNYTKANILSFFIKLPFAIKTFVLSILSGHLR